MDTMPIVLQWGDILARVALSLIAGALIGFDRSEAGKTAGLRTAMLVCAAACLAMLQVNALLGQSGKTPQSFAQLDLMRLPLGILTGMGFIGGGAILHRDGLVTGVTTAATLWFVTVIGLCIGGGQLQLGALGLAVGLVVIWPLRHVEQRLRRTRTALVTVEYEIASTSRDRLLALMREAGFKCRVRGFHEAATQSLREETFVVQWRETPDNDAMVHRLTGMAGPAGLKSIRCSAEN